MKSVPEKKSLLQPASPKHLPVFWIIMYIFFPRIKLLLLSPAHDFLLIISLRLLKIAESCQATQVLSNLFYIIKGDHSPLDFP